jgi:hypothetical protein
VGNLESDDLNFAGSDDRGTGMEAAFAVFLLSGAGIVSSNSGGANVGNGISTAVSTLFPEVAWPASIKDRDSQFDEQVGAVVEVVV